MMELIFLVFAFATVCGLIYDYRLRARLDAEHEIRKARNEGYLAGMAAAKNAERYAATFALVDARLKATSAASRKS